jgi:sigma-B regulation protein RsbU (phosphoserine phosphatase)
MMLRTRLTLMVSAGFLVVLALLSLNGWIREAAVERRYEQAEIADYRNAWNGIVNTQMRRLEAELNILPNVEGLLHMMSGDAAEMQARTVDSEPRANEMSAFFADLVARARSRIPDVEMEVVRADGKLMYASHPGGPYFLAGDQLNRVLNASEAPSGLVALPAGAVHLAVGSPVFTRAGASGAVGLTVDAATLLPAMKSSTSAALFLISPDGRVLSALADKPWSSLGIEAEQTSPNGNFRRFDRKGSTFEAIELPLVGWNGKPLATLVSVADVTAAWRRGQLVSALNYGAVLAAVSLLLGALNWYLRASFRPLNVMIRVLNALSRGDNSVVGPASVGHDEIGRLARTVESFRRSQQLLAETTAAKERTDSELSVARAIQARMVPHEFDFPGHPEFSLHAVMEPAKAVGGDLYDFFLIDERRLFFLIGDVSDKGVPAALYMAITKALFKNVALHTDIPLNEVMSRVNKQLTEDNPSEMFVTVFACVLDLETGVVVYSDGGHETPIRLRADGKVQLMPKRGGLVLGFQDDYQYQVSEFTLQPGDALVLYTDGVNEAMDATNQMFKIDRITRTLAAGAPGETSEDIAVSLLSEVRGFVGGAPQSDDITILVVRWNGPASRFATAELRLGQPLAASA